LRTAITALAAIAAIASFFSTRDLLGRVVTAARVTAADERRAR
jgi:hypothetical protein